MSRSPYHPFRDVMDTCTLCSLPLNAVPALGIYQKMANGEFPKSITLGPRAVGWLESSIDDWIQSRVALSSKAES